MVKRFDPGIVPKKEQLPKGQFISKFDGVCSVCGFATQIGDILHFVNDKAAHVTCHSTSPDATESDGYSYARRLDGFRRFGNFNDNAGGESEEFKSGAPVRGKRKPKMCDKCFMEHAGTAPDDCP